MPIQESTTLVTGGSRNIGRAAALAVAQSGNRVMDRLPRLRRDTLDHRGHATRRRLLKAV